MHRPRTKTLLAAVTVLVPLIVLALLLTRFLGQQADLDRLRTQAAMEQAARDIGGSMAVRLELLALETLGRHWDSASRIQRPAPPVSAIIDENEGVPRLLWQGGDPAGAEIEMARMLEFGGRLAEAARRYRRLQSGTSPAIQAAASMGLARTLGRRGDGEAADEIWQEVLQTPLSVLDDLGIPYSLYAARRLQDWNLMVEGVQEGAALSPQAVHMLRTGLEEDRQPFPEGLEAWLADAMWAEQLVATWSEVRFRLDARPEAWVLMDGRLLRGFESGDGRRSVVAIHAEPVFGSAAGALGLEGSFISPGSVTIEPFNGLAASISLPESRLPGQDRRLLSVLVMLAVLLPLAAGLLLWRENRRERELAATRAGFVASVSHEMRTPLTTIGVFAESLLNRWTTDDDQRDEYLQTIVSESARLGRLIGNVLDLSAIERGARVYHRAHTDLRTPIEAACRALGAAAAGKEMDITLQLEPVHAKADKDAIEQAVMNLVGNAIKYSPSGSAVRVSLKRDGAEARITVTDQGPGIAASDQVRIFESFFRGESSAGITGAGIGLSVTKHIAEGHGGRIELESGLGSGSSFTLVVPVGDA